MEINSIIRKVELSEIEKSIYFECQMEDSIVYNISVEIQTEKLDKNMVRSALILLANEQYALNSSINIIDGIPYLIVHKNVDLPFADFSCTGDDY